MPVPSRCLRAPVASSETTCSVDCSWPLNGNAEPPLASVTASPPMALDGDVGAAGISLPHAAAKTHKPNTTYRMMADLSRSGTFGGARQHQSLFLREGILCALLIRRMYAIAHEVGFHTSGTGPDLVTLGVGNANGNARSVGSCWVADSPARGAHASNHQPCVVLNCTVAAPRSRHSARFATNTSCRGRKRSGYGQCDHRGLVL